MPVEPGHELPCQLETEIETLGPDVEDDVTRGGGRPVLLTLDGRERVQ